MLPVQRSTPAEGSVGGVGGASTTTSRRLATATTSKGRCSGRSATTAPAASKAVVAEGRHRGAVRHAEKIRGLPPPEPARPRTPGAGGGSNACRSCSTGSKARNCADLPCRAQQERAASFRRAGHLHLQTTPDCRPQCRGAAVSCLRPQPRHRRDRVLELHMHGSPIHCRSAGSISASPAISCGSGPPRPQISAAPSISARRESPHDPRLSQSVRAIALFKPKFSFGAAGFR